MPRRPISSLLLSIAILLFSFSVTLSSAAAEPVWISHPEVTTAQSRTNQVSLQFRREFNLERLPRTLLIEVSADNRYVLFVNGARVAAGPSRSDLAHWRYRRIDLAAHLVRGRNVIAAHVWNDGAAAASVAQISARTGFWLNATGALTVDLDSDSQWLVRVDRSRTVVPARASIEAAVGQKYYAAGPPETLDAKFMAADWNALRSELTDWLPATAALAHNEASPWQLSNDPLPQMRATPMTGGRMVRMTGVSGGGFPDKPLVIPANSEVTLRLDMGALRAAYPRVKTSGGAGATIDLTYGEAPYGPDREYLANRGDAAKGAILGLTDRFLPNGSKNQIFAPYWWRAWRYSEFKIKTAEQPLTLKSFDRLATGYPFETRASFKSNDPELNRIWQMGWDTVQLDSYETYMDTAYWEQLQYAGDTRIQALVSDSVSGDPRLASQAIEALAHSRQDGIIQSRWPSNTQQSIPPFALLWVGMMHDYWMRQPDPKPVREGLDAMRTSLDWYAHHVKPDGLVGTTPGWEFIDWTGWLSNYPETTDPRETERCVISMMYIGALKQAAEIEGALGDPLRANNNRTHAAELTTAVRNQCWSAERGLFADHPDMSRFSQHANILAVLYDVAPQGDQKAILRHILVEGRWPQAPQGVATATFYFDFYLARALEHAGMGDRYLEMLAPWRKMLQKGFTTWPESPDPSRSDSHAWSAHPTYDLLAIVAGVKPAAPGFDQVRIAPKLGQLKSLKASIAHPKGLISVDYRVDRAGGLRAVISLPLGLEGRFEWGQTVHKLSPGTNRLRLSANVFGQTPF